MLVLSRKLNEVIMIRDDIEITVIAIKNSSIRLGITAPKNTPIHREEIYKKIKQDEYQRNEKTTPK